MMFPGDMGDFGDKFRKAREKKELSLDDVSNVTKISTRMLQAIEEENFDQLPGGVFNRGFIRAYAKHLGLDSEEAVNDYLACLRQAQIDSHAGWDPELRPDPRRPEVTKVGVAPPPQQAVRVQTRVAVEELPDLQLPRAEHIRAAKKEYLGAPASGTPWTLIVIALVLVFAGALFWIRHNRSNTAANAATGEPAQQTVSTPTPTPTISSVSAQSQAAPSQPTPTTAATPVPAVSKLQPTAAAEKISARPPTPALQPEPADTNQVKVERKGDVTIRSFGATASKPAEEATAKLTLVIRASENSWISVTSDGQLVTQETLIAPAATSYRATRELVVRVGNAAAISFLWNGQEFPAQGAESEAKTFVFDAQGMHQQ